VNRIPWDTSWQATLSEDEAGDPLKDGFVDSIDLEEFEYRREATK
jgi:hypothetical protein